MTASSLWPALALLLVLALLPLTVKLARNKGWVKLPADSGMATVRSVTHVGPGQRLLTVEVRDGTHKRMLLVGATAQALNVLDQWPVQELTSPYSTAPQAQSAQQPAQVLPTHQARLSDSKESS